MKKIDADKVDLERIKNTFIEMNNEKGILGLALLEEIVFQRRTLAKMRKEIDENSLTADYSCYKRSNPVIAGYNAMTTNYSKLMKQVLDLLPEEEQKDVSVEDFLNEEY